MNKPAYDLIATVVTYHQSTAMLDNLVKSFFEAVAFANTKTKETKEIKENFKAKLVFIDNSSSTVIAQFAHQQQRLGLDLLYIDAESNNGFGAGHNVGILKFADQAKYFLILNPDVTIHQNTLFGLFQFMEKHPGVSLSAPLILNPDNSVQLVHKRFPGIKELFLRRFMPRFLLNKSDFLKRQVKKIDDRYTLMDFYPFHSPLVVPVLSGCFMFFRATSLLEIGGFDQRYFMYMEDFDISRRAHEQGKVVFNPQFSITHQWARGSHHNIYLTLVTISSVLKYFLKWSFKNPPLEPQLFTTHI